MNAYELADEYEYTKKEHDAFMENPTDANRINVLCKRDEFSKKLIRQQADRIAELEQNLSAYIVELELHKAMIQDLERQLKNV